MLECAVVAQIPDPGLHLTRSYGAYSNRLRKKWERPRAGAGASASGATRTPSRAAGESGSPGADAPDSEFVKKRKASWARLMRNILEVDPRACPRCNTEMRVVAVITKPAVIDRILRHVSGNGGNDVHVQRGPPPDGDAVLAGVADEAE